MSGEAVIAMIVISRPWFHVFYVPEESLPESSNWRPEITQLNLPYIKIIFFSYFPWQQLLILENRHLRPQWTIQLGLRICVGGKLYEVLYFCKSQLFHPLSVKCLSFML